MEKITKNFLVKFLKNYTDLLQMLKPRYNYIKDQSAENIIGNWLEECWSDYSPFVKIK